MSSELYSRCKGRTAVSQNLSQVLDDIGISEEVVQRRRQTFLHIETMFSIHSFPSNVRFFGSQTEGTTTIDMRSDFDMLHYHNYVTIVQSDRESVKGNLNLLMVKDSTTAPGYCRLHLMKTTDALAASVVFPGGFHYMLEKRKLCILNKSMFGYYPTLTGAFDRYNSRRGPSKQMFMFTADVSSFKLGSLFSKKMSLLKPIDDVKALPFVSWPPESIDWLSKKRKMQWPSEKMMKAVLEHTCLLVPVGHAESDRVMAEWRISYSITERYLMFSLNIIQIQCYVLLKLIKQSFLSQKITSYHLKNLVFYIVSRSNENDWTEMSLFSFVLLCLKTLYLWVQAGYCPNFIDPKINMFRGKLSFNHRKALCERIIYLVENENTFLFKIKVDMLGPRLLSMASNVQVCAEAMTKSDMSTHIEKTLKYAYSNYKSFFVNDFFCTGGRYFPFLLNCLKRGSLQERAAAMSLLPGLFCQVAANEISKSIFEQNLFSQNAFWFLRFGYIHDYFSTELKVATVCYRLGLRDKTLEILDCLESYTRADLSNVHTSCSIRYAVWPGGILKKKSEIANCVRFLRQEIPLCPYNLIFEMFRTTKKDRHCRYAVAENWFDSAEIDPVPYFYYLKYLTFSRMEKKAEAENALEAFLLQLKCRDLSHPETLWNLSGQLCVRDGEANLGLLCYKMSLRHRYNNNAAKWLLGLLVYYQFKKNKYDN